MDLDWLKWIGIALCVSQSALFSGLNLALFSVSRLGLEVRAAGGNPAARDVLRLRKDSNFALTTILWGNVGINVLLTLLSNSMLTGITAFLFSTVLITLVGEILPQAYFSRHALAVASRLAPVLSLYQTLLYPVAKPTALVLDALLGREGPHFFKERDVRTLIARHTEALQGEVSRIEALGAINFLDIDDIPVGQEGEQIDPRSILEVPERSGHPLLPAIQRSVDDPFLKAVHASGKKWVVLVNPQRQPIAVLDAHRFLREALLGESPFRPYSCLHRPIVLTQADIPLGEAIVRMKVRPEHPEDDVIDTDLILVWVNPPRIITGADLLGRLMRGIVPMERGSSGWAPTLRQEPPATGTPASGARPAGSPSAGPPSP
jgi:metal transporter CNNM